MCGPFSEPLYTLYQQGNGEPYGQQFLNRRRDLTPDGSALGVAFSRKDRGSRLRARCRNYLHDDR